MAASPTGRNGCLIGAPFRPAVETSLIAALIFTGPALTWLVLADAIAVGVLALADLAGPEVSTENVVHRLEVTGDAQVRNPQGSDLPAGRVAA